MRAVRDDSTSQMSRYRGINIAFRIYVISIFMFDASTLFKSNSVEMEVAIVHDLNSRVGPDKNVSFSCLP